MNLISAKIPIIYIISSAHSGSTLLDLLLGSHSMIESVGEIKMYHGFMDPSSELPKNKNCTCGDKAYDCNYWTRVKKLAKEVEFFLDIKSNDPVVFERSNSVLLRAILKNSQKKICCDSSKDLTRLRLLMQSDLFEVFVIHLVRDGRAVAYSSRRKSKRTGEKSHKFYQTLKQWSDYNMLLEDRISKDINYHKIHYEYLVENPARCISGLLEKLNLNFEEKQLSFSEMLHHNLGGNEMRKKIKQKIEFDDEYLREISSIEWFCSSVYAYRALNMHRYSFSKAEQSENKKY